ncbi:LysR family substrate-binding domain-containing protein [Actinocrinis puniceicyclus]|uniref:LysR family substrate-binding domain-containing protein n=1 Tax=Actinocrinis puniceicyclus TaxID=977794 RepID=A0A8J7WHM5_9ACTN|nr:LysR family substrate-binding domain-containing protein [Actinocrinis puniceicyclus]MBS2962383.1 LysR family substrate-binding domain-containing protein [Actinocrinis puniceicyclus]
MTGTRTATSFRLAYVPGVTPGKWARTWNERVPGVPLELIAVCAADAATALRDGTADAGLVRLPIDRTGLNAIPLYTETSVVVIPKDHEAAAVDEISVGDLDGYVSLHPLDDCLEWESPPGLPANDRPATTADAVELVAAGVGLLVVPQSLARLYHRKDLTYRPMTDVPQSSVALSWLEERTTDLMEEFIGIVRGRTVNSSRGRPPAPPAVKARPRADEGDNARKGSAHGKPGSGASKGVKQRKPRRRS